MTTLADYLRDLAHTVIKIVEPDKSFEDLTKDQQAEIETEIEEELENIKVRLIGEV